VDNIVECFAPQCDDMQLAKFNFLAVLKLKGKLCVVDPKTV
jgi:hypothetical protein